MMILVIKSYFFFKANSYNLRQKPYTCHFFHSFYGEIIKVVCAIFVVAIKDLEVQLSNLNLQIRKNAICFESLASKRETGKQMANVLYYKYQKSVLQERMLVLRKPRPKPPFHVNIRLFQSSGNGLLSKRLGKKWRTLRLW